MKRSPLSLATLSLLSFVAACSSPGDDATGANESRVAASATPLRYEGLKTPVRMKDTRDVGERATLLELKVPELANDAEAVGLTVTAVDALEPGFLTVYPCGGQRPLASTVNYAASEARANFTFAKLGANQSVCVYASTPAHVVVDLVGTVKKGVARYFRSEATRVADTRSRGVAVPPSFGTTKPGVKIPAGQEVLLDAVEGLATFYYNATVTEPSAPGFLSVYPCGKRPSTSTLNFGAGETVAAGIALTGGAVCAYANVDTHIVLDRADALMDAEVYDQDDHVAGGTEPRASLRIVAPSRVIDTRESPVEGFVVRIPIAKAVGSSPSALLSGIVNVTVTGADGPGYLTAYNCDAELPKTSTLNFVAGQTIANFAAVQASAKGEICVYRSRPSAHVIVDVTGGIEELP